MTRAEELEQALDEMIAALDAMGDAAHVKADEVRTTEGEYWYGWYRGQWTAFLLAAKTIKDKFKGANA